MNFESRYKRYNDVQLAATIERAEAMLENPKATEALKAAVEFSLTVMRKEVTDRLAGGVTGV